MEEETIQHDFLLNITSRNNSVFLLKKVSISYSYAEKFRKLIKRPLNNGFSIIHYNQTETSGGYLKVLMFSNTLVLENEYLVNNDIPKIQYIQTINFIDLSSSEDFHCMDFFNNESFLVVAKYYIYETYNYYLELKKVDTSANIVGSPYIIKSCSTEFCL